MSLPFWLQGALLPWALTALITVLHVVLPGRWVDGYVADPSASTGRPLRYRLNGLRVLGAVVLLWLLGGATGLVPLDLLFVHRWWAAAGAAALGLVFTAATVLTAPSRGDALLAELYLGRRENPRLMGGVVDAKMWLYLVGAVLLALNLLSVLAHHLAAHSGALAPGLLLGVGLMLWFVVDYLVFEHVHLTTYDIFAERVGFKLGWGCLAFYPWFYALPAFAAADQPGPGAGPLWLELAAGLFFLGWALARGANLQKHRFKSDPTAPFLGIDPVALTAPRPGGGPPFLLLASGFWGLARHINYLGEILMATGVALAVGPAGAPWAWLYPLYYVALLLPRERDDDARCADKYGPLWAAYRARVPWRILPGVY